MASFGIDVDALVTEETSFLVYEENWQALMLFISLSTQWRFAGMGSYSGLDYNAVKMVIDITPDIDDVYKTFTEIQILERAALKVFGERDK